jgi:hypothetical protein
VSRVDDLVLVRGMEDTRRTLRRWNEHPGAVLVPWFALSLLVAVGLLIATWLIAVLTRPDLTLVFIPGVTHPADGGDYVHVLIRNGLVLALHALACVAGFIAGSSMPLSAASRSGLDRWVHEKAGPAAIAFVGCATVFSLTTQAYIIGGTVATFSGQLDIAPATLLLGLLPHALPELVVLFLPLAAWLLASRQRRFDELLAATAVTVTVAVPVLLAAAAVELWVSPRLVGALAGLT